MTRDEILAALAKLPGQIERAELALLACRRAEERFEEEARDAEATLLLGGSIDGKNAEARAAQLRLQMAGHRDTAAELEQKTERARIKLHRLQAEFSAAKAMARLLAGDTAGGRAHCVGALAA